MRNSDTCILTHCILPIDEEFKWTNMQISINCRRRSVAGAAEGGKDSLVGCSCSCSLKGLDSLKDGCGLED